MRIVQLANFYSPTSGGLRTALHHLAAEYTLAGHDVTRIVPGPVTRGHSYGNARHIEIASPRLGRTGYRMITDGDAVTALLDRLQPDVIELSDKTTLVAAARRARSNGVPVVLISHERVDTVLRHRLPGFAPLGTMSRAWNRRLAQGCDAIVCASAYAAGEWRHVGADHVHRVPLGVDLERFDAAGPVNERESGTIELVCVGRLSREKHPALAIGTARELTERGVACRLHMIGDGPLAPALRAAAAGLPVVFHGHVSDPAEVARRLRSADVALAPCPVETFGLAALEAMACGTPVVVTPGGALREIVSSGAGLVAQPTPIAFATAVREVVGLDRTAAAHAARAQAQRFPWSTTGQRMLALVGSLVGDIDRLTNDHAPQLATVG